MTIETKGPGPLTLPALRGMMGDRAFYSCLMSFEELACRVSYAREVHQNESLSDMIQREIQSRRGEEIADYLREQSERFFNSLVIATYGGDPNWHALSSVNGRHENDLLAGLTKETLESVGFLTLNGDEKLFPVDGQHRLAGIKRFVANQDDSDTYDEVSVIFVAHQETQEGRQRTRRLFTTLNKTARPVSKREIIALDEDDVMAICVRRLVEETPLFDGTKIAFVAYNNMPTTNMHSLTTIGNLYDILTILFTRAKTGLKRSRLSLQRTRPSDDAIDDYFRFATNFFTEIGDNFEEVGEFFSTPDTIPVVAKYRGRHGGSVMFRPIGLDMFARIVAQLTATMELSEAIRLAAKLPRILTEAPYAGLMWDISTSTISNAHRVTLREVLLRMLGRSKMSDAYLTERYRRETGDEMATLPDRVV